jgi:hypothetical protein
MLPTAAEDGETYCYHPRLAVVGIENTEKKGFLIGTQIRSDASHAQIFADKAKPMWFYLRRSRLFCVNLRSIGFDTNSFK